MTIQAILDKIDETKANTIETRDKVAWLSELDAKVYREVYMTHEGWPERIVFEGYDMDTDPSTELLIPDAYSDVYVHYLATEIDNVQRETGEYTKSALRFNNSWQTFCDYWVRNHMPKSVVRQFRL